MKLNYRNEKNARIIAAQYNKPLDKPDWYKIENVTDDEAEILVYDYIGWPFNEAGEFIKAMSNLKQKKIVVRINSPGGDVWDGFAIANAIKAHPSKPITRIESLAASAASYIAVSGHEKQAFKNTMIMIHEPMTGLWGNQYEMREAADILQQISSNMIDMYADHTNVGKRELKDMLRAETWMTAKEAKEKGFIDVIIEAGNPVSAKFDLSMFAHAPSDVKDENELIKEPNIRNAEKALRDVCGLSLNDAKAILARGWKAIGEPEIDVDGMKAVASETLNKLMKKE